MGCDIHPTVEVQVDDGTWVDMGAPARLHDRTYGRFAFLTGGMVRDYSGVPRVLPEPRGYPEDSPRCPKREEPVGFSDSYSDWDGNHSASYLTLAELLAVDYEQKFVDMRPAFTGDPNFVPGEPITLREFLGEGWQEILKELKDYAGPDAAHRIRIVFDFDS